MRVNLSDRTEGRNGLMGPGLAASPVAYRYRQAPHTLNTALPVARSNQGNRSVLLLMDQVSGRGPHPQISRNEGLHAEHPRR